MTDSTSQIRIWVTGMWGFEPELHAYVGFTNTGPCTKYISESAPGDLMMIIGQHGEFSNKDDIGRVLGLVELEPRQVDEATCMSPDTYREKCRMWGAERWRHALPVTRAWRFTNQIAAKYAAPKTCSANNARAIGSTCLLLDPSEAASILDYPVVPTAVWGRDDWVKLGTIAPSEKASVAVSRGPRPTFGDRLSHHDDGENELYVFRLAGCVASIYPKMALAGKAVVKVGRSNNIHRRLTELNGGFPPKCDLKWTAYRSQKYPNASDAHDAEQALLTLMERKSFSLGAEFACVPEREIDSLITEVAGSSAFRITAPKFR